MLGMDWKSIIAEISALGATQTEMAKECGCVQSVISDIGRGAIKNPSYPVGKSLIEMRDKLERNSKRRRSTSEKRAA